jgi:hypothetical protein
MIIWIKCFGKMYDLKYPSVFNSHTCLKYGYGIKREEENEPEDGY